MHSNQSCHPLTLQRLAQQARNSPKRVIDGVVVNGVVVDKVVVQQGTFSRQFQHPLGAMVQNTLVIAVPSELFSERKFNQRSKQVISLKVQSNPRDIESIFIP